jgi:hypothetical protein
MVESSDQKVLPALYLKFANVKGRAESESLALHGAKVGP